MIMKTTAPGKQTSIQAKQNRDKNITSNCGQGSQSSTTTSAGTTHPISQPFVTTLPMSQPFVTTLPISQPFVTTHPISQPFVTTLLIFQPFVTTLLISRPFVTTLPISQPFVTTLPTSADTAPPIVNHHLNSYITHCEPSPQDPKHTRN